MNAADLVITLAQIGAGVRPGAVPELDSPNQWPAVVELAIEHRVAPLVYQALGGAKAGVVPDPIAARLEDQMWRSRGARIMLEHHLQALLKALSAQGVDVLVLKGAALAHGLYPAPELRFYHDLDILCRPSDYPRLRDTLLSSGYASDDPHDALTHRRSRLESHAVRNFVDPSGSVELEVHFDVLQFGLVERHHDAFWHAARTMTAGPMEMRVLAPAHQLLHIAAHAHRHCYSRLLWLIDLDLLVRRWGDEIDWECAMRTARAEGLGTVLRHALATAADVLGSAPPPLPRPTPEEMLLGLCYRALWPRRRVRRLQRVEHRRLVRFHPGTTVARDVAYGLVLVGRRKDKWPIMRRYGWRRSGR